MTLRAPAIVILLVLLQATQVLAQNRFKQPNCQLTRCEGKDILEQEHNKDHFQFKTYSNVYERNSLHVYRTCVVNTGDKDLQIKWDIVGPDNWILRGCADSSEREKANRNDYGYYSPGSCLRFGNSWNSNSYLRAKFHAHIDETSAIDADKKKGDDCRQSQASLISTQVADFVRSITKRISFVAPYDEKDSEQTMTKISIDLFINLDPDKRIVGQTLSYRSEAAYLDNKDFKAGRFRVLPTESVRPAFAEAADGRSIDKDGAFFFAESDKISVTYPVRGIPALTPMAYTVFNQNNTRVGSILVPTWVGLTPR